MGNIFCFCKCLHRPVPESKTEEEVKITVPAQGIPPLHVKFYAIFTNITERNFRRCIIETRFYKYFAIVAAKVWFPDKKAFKFLQDFSLYKMVVILFTLKNLVHPMTLLLGQLICILLYVQVPFLH